MQPAVARKSRLSQHGPTQGLGRPSRHAAEAHCFPPPQPSTGRKPAKAQTTNRLGARNPPGSRDQMRHMTTTPWCAAIPVLQAQLNRPSVTPDIPRLSTLLASPGVSQRGRQIVPFLPFPPASKRLRNSQPGCLGTSRGLRTGWLSASHVASRSEVGWAWWLSRPWLDCLTS